jgi:hypothetical protein
VDFPSLMIGGFRFAQPTLRPTAYGLMSDVLRKNSAVDHQSLAARIHRLIEKFHDARGH